MDSGKVIANHSLIGQKPQLTILRTNQIILKVSFLIALVYQNNNIKHNYSVTSHKFKTKVT